MSHMCALPSPPPLKRRMPKALRCSVVMPLACARHSALGCAGRAPVRVSGNTRMLPSKAAAQVAVRGPPQLCSDTTCTQDSAHVHLQKVKYQSEKKQRYNLDPICRVEFNKNTVVLIVSLIALNLLINKTLNQSKNALLQWNTYYANMLVLGTIMHCCKEMNVLTSAIAGIAGFE
jgi:hypothetical protein